MTNDICPVCGENGIRSVHRSGIPILQNLVYSTAEEAKNSPRGSLDLATCQGCSFSWNASFDSTAIVYDERYDNHVASATFTDYYRGLAQMLIERFDIRDGTVYDIGCGKGEFLRVFATLAPNVRCIGIDPSCTPVVDKNFELRCMRFDRSVFDGDAKLVLLRHVLEHIDAPVTFLAALRAAMPAAPLFVEVPDLNWIVKAGAFWDFCYEHCNYFTQTSLANVLMRAGFAIQAQHLSFGDQYQWALAQPADTGTLIVDATEQITALKTYAAAEISSFEKFIDRASAVGGLVVWGMSTKGVMLSTILGPERILAAIDLNASKQGRFAAVSGVEIRSQEILSRLSPGKIILVMNPNYYTEIKDIVSGIRKDLSLEIA